MKDESRQFNSIYQTNIRDLWLITIIVISLFCSKRIFLTNLLLIKLVFDVILPQIVQFSQALCVHPKSCQHYSIWSACKKVYDARFGALQLYNPTWAYSAASCSSYVCFFFPSFLLLIFKKYTVIVNFGQKSAKFGNF